MQHDRNIINNVVHLGVSPEVDNKSSDHLYHSLFECLNIVKKTLLSIEKHVQQICDFQESKVRKSYYNMYSRNKLEWILISSVMDRICIIFYTIAIIVSLVLFLPMP